MSRKVPGGPPLGAAERLKAEMIARTNQPFAPTSFYVSNNENEMAARNQMNFPARAINPMPEADTRMQQIQDLKAAHLIDPSMPMIQGPELIDYYASKQAQEELAMFDAWFENRVSRMTDVELAKAKEVNPDWFARRADVIREAVNLQLDYAMLKLNGLQTLEDLYFEYAVETQRTHIPTGPVYNPYLWNLNEAGVSEKDDWITISQAMEKHGKYSYEAGLFSPFKTVTDANAPYGKNPFLPVDPGGNPAAKGKGPYGVFGAWTSNIANMYGTRDLNLDRRNRLRNDPAIGGISMNRFNNQTTMNVAGQYSTTPYDYKFKSKDNSNPTLSNASWSGPAVNAQNQGYISGYRTQTARSSNNSSSSAQSSSSNIIMPDSQPDSAGGFS